MRPWRRGVVTALAAIAVFVLLFPFSGTDGQPQMHYSVFGTRVPTDNALLALGAAIVAGGVVWVATRSPGR